MIKYDKYEEDLIKLGYEKHEQRVEIIQSLWNFVEIVKNTYNRYEKE